MDILDPQILKELQDSAGADFVAELLQTFLEDAPPLLAELQRAQAAGDAAAFKRAAHTLKSNGHTFGAVELSTLARELELSPLPTLGEQAAPRLAALAQAYERAATALKAMNHG
ncbi:Hpt domain-containing protein [Aquabacterium sp.]|uniref:Hpt domain-containing protein n=1 Tax=Aquabacterium sp. TaxID=1872578 RepID=UPI0037842B42